MGPDKLKEVTEFFKKVKANEIDKTSLCAEEDLMCQFQTYWTAPVSPFPPPALIESPLISILLRLVHAESAELGCLLGGDIADDLGVLRQLQR